jgi:hypothetical protein
VLLLQSWQATHNLRLNTMPLQATSGAASYDAFGGGVPVVPAYIEEVFQTWLYTGNGSTQTITNGIDLSTKGGLVWTKYRNDGYWHTWFDTVRGNTKVIYSNSTSAQDTLTNAITSFTSTGYTLGADTNGGNNTSGGSFVSWTFREAPKFFDVVTWTGDDSTTRELPHSLASLPGFIIIKRTNGTGGWEAFARDNSNNFNRLFLNTTGSVFWVTAQTNIASSTNLNVGYLQANLGSLNVSGETYVAYLFAHNAGGFGLTGTDNVISCGSFTTNAAGWGSVTLGYEPQWILYRNTTNVDDWYITDTMRGQTTGSTTSVSIDPNTNTVWLKPNSSAAEVTNLPEYGAKTQSQGFTYVGGGGTSSSSTYIYIAIRRGPMKVPTSGTSVFSPVAQTIGTGSLVTTGFVTDAGISRPLSSSTGGLVESRLTGNRYMQSSNTDAESAGSASWAYMNGYSPIPWSGSGLSSIAWSFRRAPSFFDEVCYTQSVSSGTQTINHNLGVAPQLVILKTRSVADSWKVGSSLVSGNCPLNSEQAFSGTSPVNTLTSTTFGFNAGSHGYSIGTTYVAYLFSTCVGISKVGTYTGTATTLQVDCGFTAGARFVLIKRTDEDISTGISGPWYVWDSARGIVSGNDPYLLLNSTAAEVTNTDYVDTYSAGFEISSTAPAAINASGGSFIFLAIS